MTACEHGPNNTAGCDQEMIWHNGKWYSPHFEASHWSRLKKGTAKPKAPTLTEEQLDAKVTLMSTQFGRKATEAEAIIATHPATATAEEIVLAVLSGKLG